MKKSTMDGNTAASHVSYAFSELAVIYPITPSSPMAEQADVWANQNKCNLFGNVPKVVQMQSESGVAGAVHGALTCGALTTTYTCSQGLLLMIPDMYKIAGELLPTVFHVSARALATHALSIFGDHQDVMACRQTGFAMLCSSSVQEVMDLSLVAHIATLKASVPFLHFFDGFRTSHEIDTIDVIEYDEMQKLIPENAIRAFRERGLTPDKPLQRGTAQNADIYFQNREAANPAYNALPSIVQGVMDEVGALTGRTYKLFDYFGVPDAEYALVMMGSGCNTAEETVERMCKRGEKCALIKVRLYRPFSTQAFVNALPKTVRKIAVLDRTKEAGAIGEPLYLDVCAALRKEHRNNVAVYGGRYGLGQKDFTPADCLAVFENLKKESPKSPFTVGILDDVSHLSLDVLPFHATDRDYTACKFYGLGSDGTVGANKNSIKIIGNHTPLFVQGYFEYDSKKSGGVTISHLRFGKTPIRASYLITDADFIACHNPSYPTRYDMLSQLRENGTFLLNCPWESVDELETHLPPRFCRQLARKNARLYVIDATRVANGLGLRGKHSTIMQAAFFYLHQDVLPYSTAITALKSELATLFARKGEDVVQKNIAAVDAAEKHVREIEYPSSWAQMQDEEQKTEKDAYFERFIRPILALQGNKLPVSAFNPDGSVPTATTRLEKHGVAAVIPKWIMENCIQCNQCSYVCPHACIRPYLVSENERKEPSFACKPAVGLKGLLFRVQVSPHDCMGCGVCANVCPAKEKALVMTDASERIEKEGKNWEYAQTLPRQNTDVFKRNSVKGSQFYPPLFEFSYACSGCGETPYIKILTQLFGEKMLIANATGCSSIYGGSAPTCPYTINRENKGPAWANSLFEDNAEFGYGMRLASDILTQKNERSVWIIGGDGWAYDIGYGGLDHVLASKANVNVLILDSEVYSNTGGQLSKATQLGAVARFASAGKRIKKKELGLMALAYEHVYVAQVALGANKQQYLQALCEAESYDGPSLIIAYSPCIAHGVNMSKSVDEEKRAVESGYWPLFRYNPSAKSEKKNPLTIDSPTPTLSLREFMLGENRFAQLFSAHAALAEELVKEAESNCQRRLSFLQRLSAFYADLE